MNQALFHAYKDFQTIAIFRALIMISRYRIMCQRLVTGDSGTVWREKKYSKLQIRGSQSTSYADVREKLFYLK